MDGSRVAWEFLRRRGPLHTLVTIQIAFSHVSPGTDAIILAAFGLLHPQWLRSFCAAFMHVPRAHTGVGELTSECEVKVPFFSVVTQLPSLCFLSVVFCGVLAAC